MIRNAIVALALLASTAAFAAAPNFAKEESLVLGLVRSTILDEADQMHTQVKKGTQATAIRGEYNDVIGYSLLITVEGYSYEQGNYEQTFRVETENGNVAKIERVK